MPARRIVTGMSWCLEKDYPRFREIMADRDVLALANHTSRE